MKSSPRFFVCLTALWIALFPACNLAQSPSTATAVPALSTVRTPSSDTLPPSNTDLVLQWWDYYDLIELSEALDTAIAQYEAENPQVDIQRTIVRFDTFKQQLYEAGGNGNIPDIILLDNPDHQALAADGLLADLTPYMETWPDKTQYVEGVWASTLYEGRNYGVPFESNATALFYNQDMLTDSGLSTPPETWKELREYAKQLTDTNRYGLCFATSADEEGTFTFLPFLWQADGDVHTIGDPATVKALTYWNDLINVDGSAPRGPMTQNEVRNRFSSGHCAMMINGPWAIADLIDNNVAFNWAVAPWPRDIAAASILGGENFAVGAGSHIAAAWAVIDWMSEPEHLKAPLLTVGLPNRNDMLNDPAWTSDPNVQVFIDQVAIARPRAYGVQYPQISEQIWIMFSNVLDGYQTPEEAAMIARNAIASLQDTP